VKNNSKLILRFTLVAEQPSSRDEERLSVVSNNNSIAGIKRYTGFVRGRDLYPLFDYVSLEANPRAAKIGSVTEAIQESLEETPELFPFKSKGILIGTAGYESLQRNRFELTFEHQDSEGILDGGHNMLAIGMHMLSNVADEKEINKISLWEEMKELWDKRRDDLETMKERFDFLVPVELLVPSDPDDINAVKKFEMSVLDICAARNNNAQLTQETKSNKLGFYTEIRDRLDPAIAARVEWKSNEWESSESRPIKVRDLLALAWIPLNKANEENLLPLDIYVAPQNIYRNKGECSKQFDKLMLHEKVSKPVDGPTHELMNDTVASCFDVLKDLPALYDQIYEEFPEAYNSNNYRFGSNNIVKIYDPVRREAAKDKTSYVATQPTTHYLNRLVNYRYPDGLIMPLVYGLKGLMEINGDCVVWATDPKVFLKKYLCDVAGAYRLVLDMANFDPQKLAKNQASHEFAVGQFEKALILHRAKNKPAN
jgi:AIPR protein